MTVEEAKFAIARLEQIQWQQQARTQRLQLAGEIVTLAVGGTGAVAMITGVSLMLRSQTSLAGAIALIAGAGAIGIGSVIGTGIQAIGARSVLAQQFDADIHALKNAVIDVC
jgi:hypothetical protein